MTKSLQAIRGMNDILPEDMLYWHFLEDALGHLTRAYGYREIRTPIVENTTLFSRSIGEVTDIVEKEMYTFLDRNGDSLTLRPEGTAGCLRACIEHGLTYNQTQRLWYLGPIFRHERPQKGRYRQFYQFGVEALGMSDPLIDVEMILMTARLWRVLGLQDKITLEINTLGKLEERQQYREILIEYFKKHYQDLDADSMRRLHSNPLRILDSKNPAMQTLIQEAPSLHAALSRESMQHFESILQPLDAAGIKYHVNPRLVRGLDYYCDTVFEWVTKDLGAQGTVCAGGRYDGLAEMLGGQATPAIGYAMGCERIIELLKDSKIDCSCFIDSPYAYLITIGNEAKASGLLLAERLRDIPDGFRLMTHCGDESLKSQMKRADKSGAEIAIIIGEDEVSKQQVTVKYLRLDKPQQTISEDQLFKLINNEFANH